MAALPLLELGADAYGRGLEHGRTMTESVRANIETYLSRFEAGGVSRSDARAEGAGVPLSDIAMLNARYEIIYGVFGDEADKIAGRSPEPEPDGCTAFGALPEATASGHTIIGQNWDWLSGLRGRTFIVRVRRPERPDFVGFTEAGIVGCKMGVNEAGIGLVVNGLVSEDDGKLAYQRAFHVRCREVLDAWRFDKALFALIQSDWVGSANVLLGHADGEVIDVEASPFRNTYLYPVDGLLTHANHFVHPHSAGSKFERVTPGTLYRGPRLDRLLRAHLGRVDVGHVEEALRDHFSHPASICRHEDESLPAVMQGCTVASIILDLTARSMRVTAGPPCEHPYQEFTLAAGAATATAAE